MQSIYLTRVPETFAAARDSKSGWFAKLRTAIDARKGPQTVQIGRWIVRKSNGNPLRWVLAFLRTTRKMICAVDDPPSVLAHNLASLIEARRANRRTRTLVADRTLQMLVADLVAARASACMTQEQVAARMGTTKSAVSRLESGVRIRPTLRTVERYALAVGASVEIRVRSAR